MQVIYKDEVEGEHDGRTDTIGINICARRISGCMEGECDGGIRSSGDRI